MQNEFYGIYFILEINVKIFVKQFNKMVSNLLKALLINQIAWIKLINFKIKYILKIRNIIINRLLKKKEIFF